VPWIVLGALVAGALLWAATSGDDQPTHRARARDLAAELRCPDCEGLSVADSSTTAARAIRADIRDRIAAGESDEKIRQVYVDRYGESILLEPEGDGLGILLWSLPVLVLGGGGAGLVLAIRRGRTGVVERANADDEDLVAEAPSAPRKRKVLVIAGIALFVAAAGLTLAAALGARLPGGTSSGNSANSGSTKSTEGIDRAEQIRRLERTVTRNPDDVDTRLLLARYLESDGRAADALRQYDDVIAVDPVNAQAHAEAGRILYLTAQNAPREQATELVDAARARLDRAVELDADYPDARFYRAIVLANEFGEFQAAQGDLQRYLVAAPNGRWAAQARQLLADVTKALETPTTAP
jgi:cytochrome c-type biogenesis protein CcmH